MLRRKLILAILPGAAFLSVRSAGAEERPLMRVFRDPGCECCRGWVRHMELAGYNIRLEERQRMDSVRRLSGAPPELMGCHMALYDGFSFEGHVPVAAIRRFLTAPGPWRGLAALGMPVGSPGMEVAGVPSQTYDIMRYDAAGRFEPFGKAIGKELL